MIIIKTTIPDLLLIEPAVFKDQRGYFFESYNQKKFKDQGIDLNFVQDNESLSTKGTIRGLHYQLAPFAQTKLVRVIEGEVYDVALDLRKKSPTFGKWYGEILSAENKRQLLIPKGFAHGFAVLSDQAVFSYKCDALYNKESERGILWNDSHLNIDWKLDPGSSIVSEKDAILPEFARADYNF